MAQYSLAVALFDFLPVLVAGWGLALLARAIGRRHAGLGPVAWAGALLVVTGGLSKASWKLTLALHQEPAAWLEHALFVALAPGFIVLAFSLYHARRAWQAGEPADQARYSGKRLLLWLALPFAAGAGAGLVYPDSRAWLFWLLALTTLASTVLIALSIMASQWSGLRWPVTACFIFSFIATIALSGLSRLPPGEASAWAQEGVNLSAQLALALGFWRLAGRMQESS